MAATKISKHQKNVLVKAFRMLQGSCIHGEQLALKAEKDPETVAKLVEHSIEMMKLAAEIEAGLLNHAGAAAVLNQIKQKRGKPTLRVVKGGG